MKVRIGLGFGQWPFEDRRANVFFDLISHCDSLGIDSIWFSDRILGPGSVLEPTVAMAAVAGCSRFMKLGTNVLIFPIRNPVIMAKELATLDFLSNGRLLLVAGLGRDDENEYLACGVPKRGRGRRTDEVIDIMRRLWTQDKVDFKGDFHCLRDVTVEPKPVQEGGPPIWIGGRSDAALRRTARLGDGWLPSFLTPQEAAQGVAFIREHAGEWGRQIPEDHYGVNMQFFISSTPEEAKRLSAPYQTVRRSDAPVEDYSAFGEGEAVLQRLREYMEGGITKFVLKPVCPPDQWFRQLEILARDVLEPLQTPFSEAEVKERAGQLTA